MFVVCLLLAFMSPVIFQGRSVCQGQLQTGHSPSVCDGSPGQSSKLLLQSPLIPAALGSSLSPLLSSQMRDVSSSHLCGGAVQCWAASAPFSVPAFCPFLCPCPCPCLCPCGWKGHFFFSPQQPGGAERPLSTALRSSVFLEAASDRCSSRTHTGCAFTFYIPNTTHPVFL